MKKWLLVLTTFLIGFSSVQAGEYIVKFKKQKLSTNSHTIPNIIEKIGPNTFLVEGDKKSLESNPEIEYVESNSKINVFGWEDFDLNEKAWGVSKMKTPMLWEENIKGNKDIIVAIIDTGVDYNHPALKHLIWKNEKEIPDNGIDDDENGYIDDLNGWDFHNNHNDPMDENSHGTHVAGTIGGKDIGVVHEVTIMPLKFLSKGGYGSLSNAIKAINYAIDNGAHIMSNSWGGGPESKIMEEAIERASQHNILFIASAGNNYSDNDKRPSYPSSYEIKNVISVAASDKDDELAIFSNWGKESVHVAAPGVSIYSSIPDNKYASYSGTSMATPHITGLAVMLIQGGFHPMKIAEILILTSDQSPTLLVQGNGRVNSYRAFHNVRIEEPQTCKHLLASVPRMIHQ